MKYSMEYIIYAPIQTKLQLCEIWRNSVSKTLSLKYDRVCQCFGLADNSFISQNIPSSVCPSKCQLIQDEIILYPSAEAPMEDTLSLP